MAGDRMSPGVPGTRQVEHHLGMGRQLDRDTPEAVPGLPKANPVTPGSC